MKLIIDIPEEVYKYITKYQNVSGCENMLTNSIVNGTSLDDVKTEIKQIRLNSARFRTSDGTVVYVDSHNVLEVLDNILENIGKESEIHSSCTDDEIHKSFWSGIEDVSKGFEEFTKMMFEQGNNKAESEQSNADSN